MTGWRRSSFCSTAECVEVMYLPEEVAIRVTEKPRGPIFASRAEWDVFVKAVKAGEFDE